LIIVIRKAQVIVKKGKGDYLAFVAKYIKARVIDYIAFLNKKRVLYLGAKGNSYTKWFLSTKPSNKK
jgi:uncharacterized protein YbcV (DUF1398 family)